ncbi:MAG: MFS transporter [Cyanobacteria bacterium P01_E01_bin.6]
MRVINALTRDQRINLLVLFAAGLMFWAGLASMLPILPLYISDLGGNSKQIGVVMACFAIGLLSSKAWLSHMADERGRKIVLMIGMSAIAIAPIGYWLFASIPVLMAVRALHGISIAAFATAYSALVVDICPPQNRGELIGYMSLVNPLGLAMGPALGGFLQSAGGYTPTFLMSAGLGLLGLLCIARVKESDAYKGMLTQHQSNHQSTSKKFWSLLVTPRIRIPAFVLLMVGIAFGTISTFVPLFIKETGVDLNIGLFYTAAAIASFSVRLLTGRASDHYGRGVFITFSLIFYGLAMIVLWQANSAVTFLIAGFLQGTGGGMLIPMVAALMADRSHPDERGRMFGLCMTGFDLGIAGAGPSLGVVADIIGYRDIFGITAVLIAVGLLAFLTLSSKDLPHSLRFALGKGCDVYAVKEVLS